MSNIIADEKVVSRLIKMDADLVARAQSGSLEAFDKLVAQHQTRVYALAYRIMDNPEDASDVQQETFVRAWRSIKSFRQDAELTTWLHRITVNICLSMKRRRDYKSTEPLYEDRLSGSGGIVCLETAHTALTVRKIIAAMPAHYRAVLVLREIEGRCFEEVARILGCSEKSARTRASKARMLVREKMRPYLEEEML